MNATAHRLIAALRLEPLPGEGGFFRQTWRSDAASAIVFLLTPDNFSALHRLAQDEMWHFYAGDPVELLQLDPHAGAVCSSRMGSDVLAGDEPQVLVPAGVWQGARIATGRIEDAAATAQELGGRNAAPPRSGGRNAAETGAGDPPRSTPACAALHGFALLGCTVFPPWNEQQFELGRRAGLLAEFPGATRLIHALTR